MTPVAFFESSAEEAERLWNAGVSLYDEVSACAVTEHLAHPLALPMYSAAMLLLSGDAARVGEMIETALDTCKCAALGQNELCAISLAIEDYLSYTADTTQVSSWLLRIEQLMERHTAAVDGDAIREALLLGTSVVLLRLRAECALPLQRASLGQRIVAFHTRYYDARQHLYCEVGRTPSLRLTTIVAAFGYMEDDATDSVRNYLLDNSFFLPRDFYGFLYMALHNLEVKNAFYPCLVEGGVPTETSGAEYLCGIVALVRYVVGVDISMLGRGIECAAPRMPAHIGYRLMLPFEKKFLCYEGEEML